MLACGRASTERRLQQKFSNTCAVRIFRFLSSHQLIGDNSRQDSCCGLGKRASAAIRDDESEIRNRVRFYHFNASTTSHLMKFSTISAKPISILLVSIASLATASGQAPLWNPHTNRQVEKYDNPPALIYRLDTSPRMISPHGVFTSYQVNVDANGNNIVGDAANECTISVDPTNGNKMVIGWRQFNSVTSNFRQGGWGYTTDAGVHWTFPGVLENNVFRSDPVTDSDETGNFFYLSLLETFCENMYRSTNGGQSWTQLQPESLAGGGDKQWFTIDKTGGPGHGFQYQSSDGINVAATASNSNDRPTGGLHGRRQSLFQAGLQTGRSMWIRTAISLSAAKGTPFPAFGRAMRRSGARPRPLTG